MRAPEWKPQEFETLLQHPELSEEALADRVGHTVGAVQVVRQGVHAYHVGQDASMLSKMMLRRLEDGAVVCPRCNAPIGPRQDVTANFEAPPPATDIKEEERSGASLEAREQRSGCIVVQITLAGLLGALAIGSSRP